MQLLVSVRNGAEARAALAGGAAIVDAKEPMAGALGAVSIATFREIATEVAGRVPLSAALGEADVEAAVEDRAQAFASAGAAFVKVGFAGIATEERVVSLLAAAARGACAAGARVIAVAYADHEDAHSLLPGVIVEAAARARVRGVLLDTAAKHGPGLYALLPPDVVSAWVRQARERGLLVAVAGRVTGADVDHLRRCRADIVGVRGAACDGGRMGTVSAERVRALAELTSAGRPAGRAGSTDRPPLVQMPPPA